MRKRDLQMNLGAAPNAALHAKLNQGEAIEEVTTRQTVRCTKRLVQIAVRLLEYHLSPAGTDLCTAKTVIHRSQEEIAGRK